MNILKRKYHELDFPLLFSLVALAVFSCIALSGATYGKTGQAIPSHIFQKQLLFEVIGFVVMLATAAFDYRTLRDFRKWIYGFSIFLLVVVFVMPSSQGAHSWIPLSLFSIQPSEFAKIALIISIASYMEEIQTKELAVYGIKHIFIMFGLFLIPFILTLKEPALGQALVMFAILAVMFLAFAKRAHFYVLLFIGLVSAACLLIVSLKYPVQSTDFIQNVLVRHHLLQSFQANRFLTWLNPSYDLSGAGYNVHQAMTAVASGEVTGEGMFQGILTDANFIPNQWTDFIFTVIAEEFGFAGSTALIVMFLILIYRLSKLAPESQDLFGSYMIIGFVGMFAFQVFENIGMNFYMSPATGITLPFISYGGSSLVANYMCIGFSLSVALRRKSLSFR